MPAFCQVKLKDLVSYEIKQGGHILRSRVVVKYLYSNNIIYILKYHIDSLKTIFVVDVASVHLQISKYG